VQAGLAAGHVIEQLLLEFRHPAFEIHRDRPEIQAP
jgi:hypothetical protein